MKKTKTDYQKFESFMAKMRNDKAKEENRRKALKEASKNTTRKSR